MPMHDIFNHLPPLGKIEVARRVLSNMTKFNVGGLTKVNLAVERLSPPPREMSAIERTRTAIAILEMAVSEMEEFVDAEILHD